MDYDFEDAVKQWSLIPIDDYDYRPPKELFSLHPIQKENLLSYTIINRYSPDRWRNKNNEMVQFMKPHLYAGKEVLEFGCGLGLDGSVLLGRNGAEVTYADLNFDTLLLAQEIYKSITDRYPRELCLISGVPPYIFPRNKFSMIWSFGVLHHTPQCGDIIKELCKVLTPDGVIKVGLTSDIRWKEFMRSDPPKDTPNHPRFMEFVRKCDAVGNYIDWYNEEKLRKTVEGFAEVKEFGYWGNNQLVKAVIAPKN